MRKLPNAASCGQKASRRDFMKSGAASVAAGGGCSTRFTIADERAKGANERIGVGFIGTGGRCRRTSGICLKLKDQGRCEPVAVCDVYAPRVRGRGREDRRQDLPQLQGAAGRSAGRRGVHRHARPASRPAGHRRGPRRQGRVLREAADALVADGPGPAARRRGREAPADRPGRHAIRGRRRLRRSPQADQGRHRRQDRPRAGGLFPPRRLGRADADSRPQRQARARSRLGAVPGRRPQSALSASPGSSSGGCTGTMPAGRRPTCWSTSSRPSSACWTWAFPSGCWAAAAPSSTTAKCPTSATSSPTTPAGRAWC